MAFFNKLLEAASLELTLHSHQFHTRSLGRSNPWNGETKKSETSANGSERGREANTLPIAD